MAKKYIILDTETTGREVQQGHRVIEIGAVLINDRSKSEEHFHTYLNPFRLIDEEASKVHGIMNEDLIDKPGFDEIAEEFIEFVDGATLVIHKLTGLFFEVTTCSKPEIPSILPIPILLYQSPYLSWTNSIDLAFAISSAEASTIPSTFFWLGQIKTQTLKSMIVPIHAPRLIIGPAGA